MPDKSNKLAEHAIKPLHQLAKGAVVQVHELLEASAFGEMDQHVSLRLKELGFLPGAVLKVIGFGLFGTDPVAVSINGTKFGLRRDEAAKIMTRPVSAA